jgi:hypothetical protein
VIGQAGGLLVAWWVGLAAYVGSDFSRIAVTGDSKSS